MNKLKVISLFSGCGGKDLGFLGGFNFLNKSYKKLPYEIVWANDFDKNACETYRNNISSHIVEGDIKQVDISNLPTADVVIGGFPCQDFSVAGKRLGTNSERGNLYLEMRNIIKTRNPEFFVAENVGGLLNIKNEKGLVLDQIIQSFSELGYLTDKFFLNAADFGVPQNRRRIFIVGFKKESGIKVTPPLFPKAIIQHVTAEQAIGDLSSNGKHVPNQSQISKAKRYAEHLQGNSAIKRDAPSPTIRAEHHGNIEFHYNNKRRLTVRECARLQSFPDDFIFHGAATYAYKQVGNAVPPVLAWHIAKHLYNLYESALEICETQK